MPFITFTLQSPMVMVVVAIRLLVFVGLRHTGWRDLALPEDHVDKTKVN